MGPSVLFIHPDLGIGGAERLVVDAALALKSRGCQVQVWTAHYDVNHCFSETLDSGIPIRCCGDWLPRSIFGRFLALCAYIRMLFLAFYIVFLSGEQFDVVFCDQISACIPIFKLTRDRKRVLFYCHFPDQLLTSRISLVKKIYRAPIDWLEEKTTGMADCILVNSHFTAQIFKETFTSLSHMKPDVLYPSLNVSNFQSCAFDGLAGLVPTKRKIVFLSINRYERKKNLKLALKSLSTLRDKVSLQDWEKIHLVLAGGYDERVRENVEYYQELNELAIKYDISNHVSFLRSFSDKQKLNLLHNCTCILYTPSNEHFGIVPVEAMYMYCPVIAVNSGGPLESVVDNVTGFLCAPTHEAFSDAMEKFVKNPSLRTTVGKSGHGRVMEKFSSEAFSNQLYHYICRLVEWK
ncbi:alpha-1,3/1,6-mannosyltransferase ALG2 [Bufo gargarizans]|uniref:alpha-1,3/1,6-mannosyltransferase ALG2 n=1 Tax=Bufo gargarizans TaxID=30331 RepID=UPI001CF40F7E|nr:alpha-1,3/1,6-mannosyltransferase ALG2 [Bufo gargarizans]